MIGFFQEHRRELTSAAMAFGAMAAIVGLALASHLIGRGSVWRRLERATVAIGHWPWVAVLFVTTSSLAMSALTTAIAGPPAPIMHDEFSYLLAADTFAHGRLTNRPVPEELTPFFETMHVLVRPTYAAKFGPAQGAILAVGQVLFGRADVGAWLGTAAACGAVTWAMFGWLPARWALIGGLVTALHPDVIQWSHGYWGGSVGMLGGALAAGSVIRILQTRGARAIAMNAAFLALGLCILANSRPYEAAVWVVIAFTTIAVFAICDLSRVRRLLGPLAIPAATVALPVIAFMLYYNHRITGDALTLPYSLHARQYMQVPLFFWQSPPPQKKQYSSEPLRDQYDRYERAYFEGQQTPYGWVRAAAAKCLKFAEHFLFRCLPMLAGLLAAPLLLRMRGGWRTRLALAYAMLFIIAWAIIPWFEWHYVGPLMAVLVCLAMQGLRAIQTWTWRGRRIGQVFVWLCLLSTLAVVPPTIAREYRNGHGGWWFERAQVERQLASSGRKHLVIVRYAPDHVSGQEWVYNGADLNRAPVLWAREIDGPATMRRLLDAYPDRTPWLLEADVNPRTPVPYPVPR